ncbi:MAG: hypothetical protein JRG76_00660 [Deltaproteobacteria bacterium]|nr:hypothetical protein [Deltaproteobacteria bacterium]MBW2412992.1 hypothetical protein [Deltaproteobacteria bacterium]
MSQQPLVELAVDREIKKVTGFRKAAIELNGEKLLELYEQQKELAPKRRDAEKKYFGQHDGTLPSKPKADKDEHLAIALYNRCRDEGPLELPDGSNLDLIDYHTDLKGSKDDKAIGNIDLLGVTEDDRLVVVALKYVAPEAKRGTTGETPLRAVIEGLAYSAILEANIDAVIEDAKSELDRKVSNEKPLVLVIGNLRYWELCRKRDAQSGAAWIAEMERLAREIQPIIGVEIRFLGLELTGEPNWATEETRPELTGAPEVLTAWEPGAGKPKPKRRGRTAANEIIEADPSRPTRKYAMIEIFSSGDTIEHHTLGRGVVQRELGPAKIEVLFDGTRKVLVHRRQPAA